MPLRCLRASVLLLSSLALVAGFFVASATPAQADSDPVKILLVGDSLTKGFTGDRTWRYWLAKHLDASGTNYRFVGDLTGLNLFRPYYVDNDFDRHHFARGGWTWANFTQVNGGKSLLTKQVEAHRPDVVVLMLGSNDLKAGESAPRTINRMSTGVAQVRAAQPNAKIVVSEVMGRTESQGYNRLLGNAVTSTEPSRAVIAKRDGWNASKMTWDKVHPNPVGETFIAESIARALSKLGITSDPGGKIYNPAASWDAVQAAPRHTFVSSGTRVKVSWDAVRIYARHMRIYLTQLRTNNRTTVTVRVPYTDKETRPTWTSPKLVSGAGYKVQIRPIRGSMFGKASAALRFAAPRKTLTRVTGLRGKNHRTSVTLSWKKKKHANGYRIWKQTYSARNKPGPWILIRSSTTGRSLAVRGLKPGGGYGFLVRPLNHGTPGSAAIITRRLPR